MISKELQNAIETHDNIFQLNWMDDVNNTSRVLTTYNFVEVFAALILGNWNSVDWEFCGAHLLIWFK